VAGQFLSENREVESGGIGPESGGGGGEVPVGEGIQTDPGGDLGGGIGGGNGTAVEVMNRK
jgi:hypothetical protein